MYGSADKTTPFERKCLPLGGEKEFMRGWRTLLIAGLSFVSTVLHGQAMPSASRDITFQVGSGFSAGRSDYGGKCITGISVFANVDLRQHVGMEFDFHDTDLGTPNDVGEITYLGGLDVEGQEVVPVQP
jgi:hypothetical protein